MDDRHDNPVLITLTPDDLQDLFYKAAEIGAKAGIDKFADELKKTRQKRGDRRLRNTKLLLRNFRMLKANAENSVFGRMQMEESASEILEQMMGMYNDDVIVESIRNSATRTAIIVSHIKNMLEIYKVCCNKSSYELDMRRYEIIYNLYIAEEILPRSEIAKKLGVSVKTTYLDEDIGVERLSAILFGVDGLSVQ
jgi:hypothetical protein